MNFWAKTNLWKKIKKWVDPLLGFGFVVPVMNAPMQFPAVLTVIIALLAFLTLPADARGGGRTARPPATIVSEVKTLSNN
ncbi:MAG: hypothetical protein ACO3JG_11015 [Luteolibacter sp.]